MEGQSKVINWFKKDSKIKIVSVAIAILLWLYVSNTANPFQTITIYNVPITIENEDYLQENGFTLKNSYSSTINVTIRGRKEAISKVKATDFETTLDFSQVKSINDKKLYLTPPVCSYKDITIVSYSPTAIDLKLARNKSAVFNVELNKNISMKPGYVLLNTTMSSDNVTINGEETLIDSVDKIKADLEVKDLDRNMTQQVKCKVYDKAGNEITSLGNKLYVTVKLEVAKQVPISLITRGSLAADAIETQRIINPVNVLITGPADIIANINELKTEQVDISGVDSNYNAQVSLVVPDGVKLENSDGKVNVAISIEKLITRDIELNRSDISILNANNSGTVNYEIKTDKLTIQLKGKNADLNNVRVANLKPAVDVAGLAEGQYSLPLNITLPSNIKLLQKAEVEVVISKVDNTEPVETPPVDEQQPER
jgi:YbbR domain-containing protein